MKKLKEAYVILKLFEGESDFFQNYISFDKAKLDSKCKKLNKEANDKFKKASKKNKLPFIPIVIYTVLTLEEAIEKFGEMLADKYIDYGPDY